jgi:hypothetical protein
VADDEKMGLPVNKVAGVDVLDAGELIMSRGLDADYGWEGNLPIDPRGEGQS